MRNVKFRYLPHIADIRFAAYGGNFSKALENASEALLNIMLDLKQIRKSNAKSESISIRESSDNLENLVWYVLQDILTQVDEKKLHAYRFQVNQFKKNKTGKASIKGRLLFKKTGMDPFLLEVKAVTPHGLLVKKRDKRYSITVLVDV